MKENFMEGAFYGSVTVGERGQIVIPAKTRKDFGIKPKDKLLVLRGIGKMGIMLIHTKHMTRIFEKMTEHFGKFKEILNK